MHYTRLISVVKTSTSAACCHLEFKLTQILVFLDSSKIVQNENWHLEVHQNKCFMKYQLVWKNFSQSILKIENALHWDDFHS